MRSLAAVAVLFAVAITCMSCSTAPPIVQPAITCGSQLVTADNIKRVENDLANLSGGGEADLLAWIETDGPPFVECLISWYLQNGTSTQRTAASRFKAGHKAQLSPQGGICPFHCAASHLAAAPPGIGPGLAWGGGT